MRSKRTDITQASIIMCKHTASHQHEAQSQGLLRPTRTERSSQEHCAPQGRQLCGGQAISSTLQVDDHMRRGSPPPEPPLTRAQLAERSSAGAKLQNGQTRALLEGSGPPTPHPPAPQGSDRPPYNSPEAGGVPKPPTQLVRPSEPGCASPEIFKDPPDSPGPMGGFLQRGKHEKGQWRIAGWAKDSSFHG